MYIFLSFYETAIKDSRFKEAFEALSSTLQDGKIVVQRDSNQNWQSYLLSKR